MLDSSTGDLRLYWGTTSTNSPTLSSLTYDTRVTRPQYQLVGQNGTIALIGTVAGADLNDVVVSISAVSGATCTVLISHGTLGTETWPLVPTDSPSFAAVLNGTPLPPPAGSIVPQTYDYTKASSTWPGAELSGGSLWVSVQPSTSTVTVLNNSQSTATTAGTPACFRAVPIANAISLDVPLQLATPPAQGAAVPATPPWDLTLETWVKPVNANGQILIGQNVPTAGSTPATGYVLGLRSTANGLAAAASMIKANSSGAQWTIQAQTTPDPTQLSTLIPAGEWSHVAAAFRQKSAVRFDGTSAFADCGDDDGTNITGDLTIEAWLSVPANQTWPLGILSRGLLGNGAVDPLTRAATVSRVPYALYVNDTGNLTFVYSRTSVNLCYAEGPPLPTGPTAIAVTRRCNLSRTDTNGNVFIWDEITFYIRGQTPTAPKVVYTINPTSAPTVSDTSPIVGNSASLILGRCTPALTHAAAPGGKGMTATPPTPAAASSFTGVLSEVRLWSAVQNPPWANLDSADATTNGLASRWRFEERSGSQAIDEGPTGRSSAMLMNGYTWVPSPDPSLSGWTLYLNGVAQRTAPISWVAYIPPANLSLGDFSPVTAPAGQVAEVRIWSTERTPQAIANNIYRPLARDPSGQVLEDGGDLLAYYALDSASGWSSVPKVVDRSLSGSGTLAPAPLNAMYWNGQTSATVVAPNIQLTSSFTIEFWCRRSDSLREGFILTQNTANPGTNQCLFIGFMGVRGENCDNQVQFAFYNNDLNVTSNANRDGIWHHWAFVYDKSS
ncbi:LamG-like jellyroll fold domain-containing protein, partial [Nannocystis sp.]|uniref:LamG-like jellyroll fold domain-containing protein n=1 Tax=Nannocystis sp. TaxID=1962667 RepID=UPI0025FB2735